MLDKLESHFYLKQMSSSFTVNPLSHDHDLQSILAQCVEPLELSPAKKPKKRSQLSSSLQMMDCSVLENWRTPNHPHSSFLNKLKLSQSQDNSCGSEYQKLMMDVRDSYTARGGIMQDMVDNKNNISNNELRNYL